jgi:hypothetical protein
MSNLAMQCLRTECPPYWIPSSGAGLDEDSSKIIVSATQKAINQLRGAVTITFGLPLAEMQESLRNIYQECSQMDWDGYGAYAISKEVYEEAQEIIDLLPKNSIPTPEIVAEPTGDIGFEWRRGKGQVFVISVSGIHRMTYAGLFAGNKVHGSEYFEGTLPPVIIHHLRRLYL